MALFDDASLVVTPNGYKEGTLYSIKPTSGAGDMTVVRATTATRVNSAGLIELVPYNLVNYSEQLNDSSWNKLNVTITPNTTIAPDGTLTADTMTNSSTGYGLWQQVSVAPSTQYTFSFYVKKGTNTSYVISVIDASTFAGIASLDYSSQVGTDWVRVSTTFTTPSTTSFIRVYQMRDGSSTGTAFLWGAQLVEGSVAKDYLRTETRLNIPRLDYSNGSCPSLLVEPQRSNLLTYSEQFDNAGWIKVNTTVTANNGVSPDGTQNADRITFGSGLAYIYQLTGGIGAYNHSVYVKGVSGQTISLDDVYTYVPLFTLNGEWQRIDFNSTTVVNPQGLAISNAQGATATTLLVWGAQVEAGSYPTSYIPTTSAAVTRNADAIYKTGISSLIGQTEGVVFIDFVWNQLTGTGSYPRIIELGNNSNNYIQLYSIAGTTSWGWDIYNGGVVQFSGGSTMALGHNKIAIGYKLNDMVIYKNGTLIASDATCTVPATNALGICGTFDGTAGAQLSASVNLAVLFPTRLTNAELAQLTTI